LALLLREARFFEAAAAAFLLDFFPPLLPLPPPLLLLPLLLFFFVDLRDATALEVDLDLGISFSRFSTALGSSFSFICSSEIPRYALEALRAYTTRYVSASQEQED